jgi:20S proteasome alpha/beta subunit
MTCVVAIKDENGIVIGADSAGSNHRQIFIRKDPKVFVVKDLVFGFCGSYRRGQLLMSLKVKPKSKAMTDFDYIRSVVATKIMDLFHDHGALRSVDGELEGSVIIIGYRNNLYVMDSDFHIGVHTEDYVAIGSGDEYALGSLQTSLQVNRFSQTDKSLKPITTDNRVGMALEAAAKFDKSVRAPFNLIRFTYKEHTKAENVKSVKKVTKTSKVKKRKRLGRK